MQHDERQTPDPPPPSTGTVDDGTAEAAGEPAAADPATGPAGPTWPQPPPPGWSEQHEGPGSPVGSVRPPDTTGTYTPGDGGGRGRRALSTGLVGALVGAVLGTAGTLAVVHTTPAFDSGTERRVPIVQVPGGDDGTGGTSISNVQSVAAAVTPSVVRVDILDRRRSGEDPAQPVEQAVGNGSGVIYRSDGYIITNNHVVAEADRIRVRLATGETVEARIVGTDPLNDLAVIRVDRTGLPAVNVRTDPPVQVGELAVAIGSPFGLDTTVTSGVISATNRRIDVPSRQGQGGLVIPNVHQTDAAINPGNSGGALVDAQGRLIGVNTAILSATGGNQGVGFAIPASEAIPVADELIQNGFVSHAFLGITGVDLTPEVAAQLDAEVSEGAVVDSVQPGTAAAEAGLQEEDVIVAVDGEPISSMTDLVVVIRGHEPGDQLELTLVRDGAERTVEVELGDRPQ